MSLIISFMKTSTFKTDLLIGITLFSMFFGAGNLIFAPMMGAQAGTNAPWALAGFLLTAAACPILSVMIISLYKNAENMLSKISPVFSLIFLTAIYLLIGPLVAIPRTALTSFSMFGWLMPDVIWTRALYSAVFFGLAAFCALKPGRLKDILGKWLTPVLIVLVVAVCVICLFSSHDTAGPFNAYTSSPFLTGLNDGYQTMDILAAFCFGPVLIINIKASGIEGSKNITRTMIKAGIIAFILLASMYSLLGLAGMNDSADLSSLANGALVLSTMSSKAFSSAGPIVTSVIFLIACFNVCCGLLSCLADYFSTRFARLDYRSWLLIFTLISLALSLFGLDAILAVSAPVLQWFCPVALIILIVFALMKLKNGIHLE